MRLDHKFLISNARETLREVSRSKLPFAGYSVQLFEKIVWDDPPVARAASEGGTPGSKFAGGHRIRVPPVPIPNTEVKPDTADGTAWETVWESRSLPALFRRPT